MKIQRSPDESAKVVFADSFNSAAVEFVRDLFKETNEWNNTQVVQVKEDESEYTPWANFRVFIMLVPSFSAISVESGW